MNLSKNGFTTINRLLGKKSKSQTISKSTSNLSIKSQSQIDTSAPLSSHLEQNSITPVPATNAPFEQTFRITVLLPKGQLFVARLGARTDLGRLLILVCENKQLDPEKYEFRHPVDSSQVYSCEKTIGAVGLNEIRLCNKSEAYDNFNADEIITMRQTVGRESLSSSELSSRNSKHTLKTASPYSSTNSLNSSDSAGMSYRGTTTSLPPQTAMSYIQKPPVAPARKKRVAPRPPSQSSILPNGAVPSQNGSEFKQPLGRKEFHVSSPNLSQGSELTTLRAAEFHKSNVSVDCNGNSRNSRDNNSTSDGSNGQLSCNGTPTVQTPPLPLSPTLSSMMRPVSMSVLNSEIHYEEKELNGNRDLTVNGSVMDLSQDKTMPEPAPRKRIIAAKKKAPAPPPRGIQPVASPRVSPAIITEVTQSEENLAEYLPNESSVKSTQPSVNITQDRKLPETRLPESITINGVKESITPPLPSPPVTAAPKTFENGHATERTLNTFNLRSGNQIPEAITTSEISPETTSTNQQPTQDLISKSPPLTPEISTKPKLESKLSLETSSDDDDQIKVYNLKLGKTISKPLSNAPFDNHTEPEMNPQSPKALSIRTETTASPTSPASPLSPARPESPEWSYTIPAPPKFADNETVMVTYQSTSNCVSPTNGSVLSDRDEILTNSTDTQNEILITSDLEDGYRGGKEQIESKLSNDVRLSSLENERKETALVKEQSEVIIADFSRTRNQSPPSSLENTESSKPEVIRQLSNTITENGGIEKILTRRSEIKEEDKIESVKPSILNNFKIQSYINKPTAIQDFILQKDKSPDIIPDEDSLYIKSTKRPSLTLSNSVAVQIRRSRSSVTRSDSFHSIHYQNSDEPNLVTSRSNSYVSLVAAQQTNLNDRFLDTNRRKSSSELSIGESPSLQSLIVMKSILNSRKNSLSNGLATDLKSPDIVDNAKPIESKNSPVIETMKTVYRRPSFKDFISISEGGSSPTTVMERNTAATTNNNIECRNSSLIDTKISELEKSVNSTHVQDKKETTSSTYDCDSSKENSPKNKIISQTKINGSESVAVVSSPTIEPEKIYKYQGPPSINLSTWNERPKVQVTIKTDNDYKFGVGNRTSIDCSAMQYQASTEVTSAPVQAKDQPSPFKVPFVRGVEYKKSTSMIQNNPATPIERVKPAEESTGQITINHSRPLSVNIPMTVGRSMPKITRSSFVPVVKGFKSIETPATIPHTETSSGDEHSNHAAPQRPVTIIRSKSSVSTNILRLSTDNNIQRVQGSFNKKDPSPPVQNTPFFSQTALRKTGFKERILADENADAGVPKHSTPRASNDQQQNSAKLELKLTTTVTSNQNSNFRNSIAKDIPPPPPPVIRSVVTKQNSLGKSACIPDTRDQLLSAIRNFNKTALKRN